MNNYWKDRFLSLEKASHKIGVETYKEIEIAFDRAQREIEKEIESWYGRFAKNNNIDMVEAKRILNTKELKELKWDVNEYIAKGRENAINQKWMKELENASARFHINRLEALKLRMQQSAELAFGNQLDLVDGLVHKVFTENYYRSIFEIQKGFNVGFKVSEIDDNLLNKIISKPWAKDGKTFSERIWGSKDKLINELHADLTQNVLLGKPPKDLINNLVKKFNTTKANASRLVMTELAFFHTVSQRDAFKELGSEQYTILAVLDNKTSLVCQDFDGKVFDTKDMSIGINAPPFHPNCRSVILPYYDDDYEIGERIVSGDDGKSVYYVPEDMNYKEWHAKYVDGVSVKGVKPPEKNYKTISISDLTRFQDLSNLCFKAFMESEKDTLRFYTDDGYSVINASLQSGDISDDIWDKVKNIDDSIERFELSEDIIVYRGTKMDYYKDVKVGDIIDAKVFYSTSFLEYIAQDFADQLNNPVMLEIKVPSGTKSLYIGYNSSVGDEAELLLSRHLKYRVLKMELGRLFLEVEE
ncbi:head morphogenesis protein [Candidatus Arthromitus sp. SFB-mouse-Japan]|uniref:minor capsid protein n=1 Tax=Candidatus Arthromitus sp. SFB-mouse TaxID=49118 RepID=UPI00021B8091|nr:minor capsid protein [Candidatus Arthromitus sp. SFB-mouse]EIA26293.1 ADP-ribosyltransferase domain protein SFB Type-1 [Candidatus Arthromitus sp. SFB-3]EIA26509.1 ADP-ribosyltransferase domain protein SFB Type-1 [Candidatus Arthromitus sp. SFB-5]EIA31349.1 ADP-ribosyltransferase domain protein SFB Type-1 [Candidatus Arthromitus sp. SFB-mouse-SU]EGX27841.1 putative phage minor head protein [Candidatus Arthromitus sp. SFB-mouse-NYU]BAK55897.1 head morphogenesis protein [Candidatus Arthromitu